MKKIFSPDLSDKRMIYAIENLKKMGYEIVSSQDLSDYTVLPPKSDLKIDSVDYLNDEGFALKNACLTAESALAIAVNESEKSLINSKILIIGYGRIAKALHKYLIPFTHNITVCARNSHQRDLAEINGAEACDFDALKIKNNYDFVFNTVPFPVMNERELNALNVDALVIDLASFPGGIDKHQARANGIKLIQAWGLPGKYSPKTAGFFIAQTVDEMIREGKI